MKKINSPEKENTSPPATEQNFPIIGIGASAGGLDAFKRLLKAIPEKSGMAYVLVQHLDPSHESILPEILARVTNIPVYEITDEIKLAPDNIYIIPANKILISTDGMLKLAVRDKKILNLSVDVFFESLADVHKELAIGVVLSGMGSDGTSGLRAIKEQGGITIAQDGQSAAYDDMPQSAINAGVVDFVLTPEEIPAQLLQIINSYKANPVLKEEEELSKNDNFVFKQILSVLHQRSGVDFTYYKQPTLQRRIARRIAITKKNSLTDYLKLLRSDKTEQDALFQDVLIPVTSFFRDPKTFTALCESVIPAILKNKKEDEPIRVWIAGCSTGEEAFSIAMCLHEFLGNKLSHTRIQIFASDISEIAIKKARTAYYSKTDVQLLSEEKLKNYFKKSNDGYEIIKVIRDMCVFAPHNFLKDPPFAKMDLISCRNVLIYMDSFLQKKALTVFHYALKESGMLLLGKSESTSPAAELFTMFDKHEKIYTRKPVPGRFIHVASERKEESLVLKNKAPKSEAMQTDFRKSADAILLSKFTPASVVINEQMDIVHIQGIITPFLEQPQGKPTFNLLKMAREGLAFELRNALHKAKISKEAVIKENVPTKINDKQSIVSFQVIPLTDTVEQHFLIVFEEKIVPVLEKKSALRKTKTEDAKIHFEQLEKELSQTREDMRSITQDMEAANEEMQSANEEMQSSNEEMQSLNEELETSKEELQSTNEELTIVNQEMLEKQEQLNTARFYAESIVATLREPLVILNKSLRIITANASFYKKYNVEEHEIADKLLSEIQNHRWDNDTIRLLLEKVLTQKEQLTDYEIVIDFPDVGNRYILMNARQIVTEKITDPFILLAIEDITEKRLSEEKIRQSEELFKSIFDNSLAAIVVSNDKGNYLSVNEAASKLLGYTVSELLQMGVGDLKTTEKDGAAKRFEEYISKGKGEGEFDFITKNGATKFIQYQAIRIKADFNLSIMMDITEQKQSFQYARSLIEASLDPFITISAKGKITDVNEASAKVTGETREKLIGTDFSDYFTEPEKARKGYKQVFESGFISDYPLTIHHKNGTLVDVLYNASVYKDDKGNVLGVFAAARDITLQKSAEERTRRSEEKLRKSKELLEIGLSVGNMALAEIDYITGTVTLSPEAAAIYGLPLDNLTISRTRLHETFHPDCKEELEKFIEQVMNPDFEGIMEVEHPILLLNGEKRWLKVSNLVYFDRTVQPAKPLYSILAVRDITDQKSFTEELIEAKSKAESSKEMAENAMISKQQFLSNMSHEIRTPLNAIIGFTNVVIKTDLSIKQKECIAAIKTSGEALIVLIDDILDLAKVDAGKMTFVQKPLELRESITNLLQLFETKMEEKNLVLVQEFDEKIPAVLLGDSVRLNQIILNLVSNAFKFTPEGKIEVSVILLSEDDDQAMIEFTVMDTGIGIAEDQLATIFENFQQATPETSYLYGGTGLGLAITKQLVEKQGGTLKVESKIGEGSTFCFTLSFQKNQTDEIVEPVIVESDVQLKNVEVLVAEDVALNQLLIKTILDDFGFTCDIAADGKVAIEKLKTKVYDIILMDLQMPEMNGFEATEYIRNIMKSDIPIIALTADVTTVKLEKCKAFGMNDYIAKPFDENILYQKMVDLLPKR